GFAEKRWNIEKFVPLVRFIDQRVVADRPGTLCLVCEPNGLGSQRVTSLDLEVTTWKEHTQAIVNGGSRDNPTPRSHSKTWHPTNGCDVCCKRVSSRFERAKMHPGVTSSKPLVSWNKSSISAPTNLASS